MSKSRHPELLELIAEVNAMSSLEVGKYDESNIYTITVKGFVDYETSFIGSLSEAITYVRGIRAALEHAR